MIRCWKFNHEALEKMFKNMFGPPPTTWHSKLIWLGRELMIVYWSLWYMPNDWSTICWGRKSWGAEDREREQETNNKYRWELDDKVEESVFSLFFLLLIYLFKCWIRKKEENLFQNILKSLKLILKEATVNLSDHFVAKIFLNGQ